MISATNEITMNIFPQLENEGGTKRRANSRDSSPEFGGGSTRGRKTNSRDSSPNLSGSWHKKLASSTYSIS
jgi:hypothetical protein